MSDDAPKRRCTDCKEHSGIVVDLEAGRICMQRLEDAVKELRTDFSNHVVSSFKGTIAMLVGILLCFLTGVVSLYVNYSINPKDRLSSQAEMTMLVKEITKAIKEAKK